MATVTLAQIRDRAKTRSDMQKTEFVTDAEWLEWINSAYTELYDLLVTTYEDYYFTSVIIPLVIGQDTYALPANFYKLRGVDLLLGSQPENFLSLRRFEWIDRARYTNGLLRGGLWNVRGGHLRYYIHGTTNIVFAPMPNITDSVKVWYVPTPVLLALDADTVQGVNGYEEYIVLEAAIRAMQKEESDVNIHMIQKAALIQRIQSVGMNRDAEGAMRMTKRDMWSGMTGGNDDDGGGFY